jgi:hypothetical protein
MLLLATLLGTGGIRFLGDSSLEIDNNIAERTLTHIAIGGSVSPTLRGGTAGVQRLGPTG